MSVVIRRLPKSTVRDVSDFGRKTALAGDGATGLQPVLFTSKSDNRPIAQICQCLKTPIRCQSGTYNVAQNRLAFVVTIRRLPKSMVRDVSDFGWKTALAWASGTRPQPAFFQIEVRQLTDP